MIEDYQFVHPTRGEHLVDGHGVEGVGEGRKPVPPYPPAWNQTPTKNESPENEHNEEHESAAGVGDKFGATDASCQTKEPCRHLLDEKNEQQLLKESASLGGESDGVVCDGNPDYRLQDRDRNSEEKVRESEGPSGIEF